MKINQNWPGEGAVRRKQERPRGETEKRARDITHEQLTKLKVGLTVANMFFLISYRSNVYTFKNIKYFLLEDFRNIVHLAQKKKSCLDLLYLDSN